MTAHAAASPLPNPSYPVRGRSKVQPAATNGAPAVTQAQDADRDRTALALAMSVAGAVGAFVAAAVALLLIGSAGHDADHGAGEGPEATTPLVADAR